MILRAQARAKINWTLDIVGRRADGYHQMDMLMQSVALCDELTAAPAEELTLLVDGADGLTENNLVLKAARLLREETGETRGAALTLTKRVPIGAGMGGGSADAAAALLLLNRLWALALPEEQLLALALRCGADVPFLLRGGFARVGGIGESLRLLAPAPHVPLVICQPCEGLSTQAIFAGFDAEAQPAHPQTDAAERALLAGDLRAFQPVMGNVLQPVSVARRPEIRQALEELRQSGAVCALMTGSGSAVFGAFATPKAADRAVDALRTRWGKTWRTETCDAGVTLSGEPLNHEG